MPIWLIISAFFKKVSLKTWIILGVVIFALIIAWRVDSSVSAYFKYVHSLEQKTKDLTDQNTRLNDRVNQLAVINDQNQKIYQEELRQADAARQVADQERQASDARANHYRSIRDAISSTPAADRHAVSPVVQSTVDRLWNNQPAGPGN